MIRIISQSTSDDNTDLIWVKLATLNSDRDAVSWATGIMTDDIYQYVIDNEAALTQQILANGAVDERLTSLLRAREAKRLLAQSRLEGKTLAQVENYIENNVTDFASAKAALSEVAGQVWMLYQVAQLTLDAID